MAEAPMMKRKRSCSALHLFAVFGAKSGANVSAGSQGGLRALGICRQGSISRNAGGEAGAAARWVRTRTRAGHSLGVTDRTAACLGAMIGKKQSGGLASSSGMAAFCYYGEEISLAIFPEYQQKHLAKRLPCMAGMGAKKSTIPFCTLLSEQSGR